MSIIEKALDKLDRQAPPAEPPPGERPEATGEASDEAPAEGAAAALAEAQPPAPAPDAPARPPGGQRTVRRVDIDMDRLHAAGIITPDSDQTVIVEQHRRIKRPLLEKASAAGSGRIANANLVMVTSALPGEGKTFLSLNLAMSMAMERDRTVLLVDTDVAKSDIGQLLGVRGPEGLTDVLEHPEVDLADVLVKTSIPKLTVLPAGRAHRNVTELFASAAMRRLVEELATRYSDRVVIFDTAPLLATTGSAVLAQLVGQVVVVVEAVRTSQRALAEALRHLGRTHDVGVVYNKSRQRAPASYGYGYYAS